MPAARDPGSAATFAILLALTIGCRTPSRPDPKITALLQTVSYDTTVPPMPASVRSREDPAPTLTPTSAPPPDQNQTFRKAIGDGLKLTAALFVYGTVKVVGTMLGFDDEDDVYESTPRGRADRDLIYWVEARERWKREDR